MKRSMRKLSGMKTFYSLFGVEVTGYRLSKPTNRTLKIGILYRM